MHSPLIYLLAQARLNELQRQARPASRGRTDRAPGPRATRRTTRLPHPLTCVTGHSTPTDPCVD